MRSFRKSLTTLSLFIFSALLLPAQTQLNVRVKKSEKALISWMQQYSVSGIQPEISKESLPASEISKIRAVRSLKTVIPESSDNMALPVFTLSFPGNNARSIAEDFIQTGKFVYADPVRSFKIHISTEAVPSDTGILHQYYHSLIRTFEAWDSTKGDSSVSVGIIDTGLDYDHPEFEGQIKINYPEDINNNGRFEAWPDTLVIDGLTGDLNGMDEDGNGFPDDVIGYDFTDQPRSPFGGDYLAPDPDPSDENDHGTLVAGIIAAKDNNQSGGTGIAPDCRIRVLRAFAANGAGEDDDVARAIVYAADNDVQVLNFSFGDIYPSRIMHDAIRYAYQEGLIMVGSAGNGTGDNLHYPSNYEEVISVSASSYNEQTESESLWPVSSFGIRVALAAPGDGIFTTVVRNGKNNSDPFGTFSGTSTAAPMVSAAAAMVLSRHPEINPEQFKGMLVSTTDDISEDGWDHFTGSGRLNLLRLMQAPGGSEVRFLSPLNDQGSSADSVRLSLRVLHPELKSFSVDYEAGIEGNKNWINIFKDGSGQVLNKSDIFWKTDSLSEGEYTLRLVAETTRGTSIEDRIRFIIDRTSPEFEFSVSAECIDNDERKMFLVYRSSDAGTTSLFFRKTGDPKWIQRTFDRKTKNGFFLFGGSDFVAGTYEYYLESVNLAGISARSDTDSLVFSPLNIGFRDFISKNRGIPQGNYLSKPSDFDKDGLKEVVMSRLTNNLGFGKLMFYEFNANEFVAADSSEFKPVLIPKDFADTDNDGLIELLTSVNDSIHIFEQSDTSAFPVSGPSVNIYQNYFPSHFADPDSDGNTEIVAKDSKDYILISADGTDFSDPIEDVSGDYQGSVAPGARTADFDGDGKQEIAFGDFDGDLLIYEHQSGDDFILTFLDTTELFRSGSYLSSGDYDGDGQQEIFVAAHSNLLRNKDFEYDAPYWLLRIFKASGNDQYEVIWEDYHFDIDTDGFNAVESGNLDQDGADEVLFSSFPRTYIIDYAGSEFEYRWFSYGSLQTDHMIGDFDGNGVNEFTLGLGDTAAWYELDFNYTGPAPVLGLRAEVRDSNSVRLDWQASAQDSSYIIYRGEYNQSQTFIARIDSTTDNFYTDSGLVNGEEYLYVLLAKNPSKTPAYSDEFSNSVILRVHDSCEVDSLYSFSPTHIVIYFTEKMNDDEMSRASFLLDGSIYPSSVIAGDGSSEKVLIGFDSLISPGTHILRLDSNLRDADKAAIRRSDLVQIFSRTADSSEFVVLKEWSVVDQSHVSISFSAQMNNSILDKNNYRLHPQGKVISAERAVGKTDEVILTVEGLAFGSLGYAVSVIVEDVYSVNSVPIHPWSGNVATFVSNEENLNSAFVYPNPARLDQLDGGIRFANLTANAEIRIYSTSGRYINTLTESDGDGGVFWDLHDSGGNKVKPGVFMFEVSNPQTDDQFVGKFAILE